MQGFRLETFELKFRQVNFGMHIKMWDAVGFNSAGAGSIKLILEYYFSSNNNWLITSALVIKLDDQI